MHETLQECGESTVDTVHETMQEVGQSTVDTVHKTMHETMQETMQVSVTEAWSASLLIFSVGWDLWH